MGARLGPWVPKYHTRRDRRRPHARTALGNRVSACRPCPVHVHGVQSATHAPPLRVGPKSSNNTPAVAHATNTQTRPHARCCCAFVR